MVVSRNAIFNENEMCVSIAPKMFIVFMMITWRHLKLRWSRIRGNTNHMIPPNKIKRLPKLQLIV